MNGVVNREYRYEMDEESPESRCVRTKLQSDEDSYGFGGRCTIQVPNTANSVLNTANSWVDLSVTFSNLTGTGSAALTGLRMSNIGIYSIISEILVEQGSNLLQHTRNHQEIISILNTLNTDEAATLPNSVLAGMPNLTATRTRFGQAQTVTVDSSGISGIAKQDFSICLIGILSSVKKLPLFQLNMPLRVSLVFANNINQVLYSSLSSTVSSLTGGTCEIRAQYNAEIITLSDRAITDIKNASNINSTGILAYSDTAVECVVSVVTHAEQGATSETIKTQIQGGLKPQKLLGCLLYGVPTPNGNTDAYQTLNYGSNSFQIRLGSKLHPPRAYEKAENARAAIGVFGQTDLTLATNQLSVAYNKNSQRQNATTVVQAIGAPLHFGVVGGHSFKSWFDSRDGIDSSNKQMETMVSLKVGSVAASFDIRSCFLKRYGIIVSVSADGQMSVNH